MREGAERFAAATMRSSAAVTSGAFGPTVGGPVAMAYVDAAHAATDTSLQVVLRGRSVPATVTKTPFVPHNYHR